MRTSNSFIIEQLKSYLQKGWMDKARSKNPEFAEAVAQISEKDLSFGNAPIMCFGIITGNSTAVGTCTDGYNQITRTISMDFNSDTYLFVDKNYNTSVSMIKVAQRYFPEIRGFDIKYRCEAESIAEKIGKNFCRQSLNDLNFTLSEYRLNRYKLITEDCFTLPIRTINAEICVNNKQKTIRIGSWYEKDGKEYVDIYINDVPATAKTKLIVAGIVVAIIVAILLIISSL